MNRTLFPSLPLLLTSLALGPACSDYELGQTGDDDQPPGDDDTTAGPDDDSTPPGDDDTTAYPCSDRDFPPETVPITSICSEPTELQVVAEWFDPAWTIQPGAKYSESTPVVAQLSDDNGDGSIDEDDMPDILMNYFESTSYEEQSALRAMSGDGTGELWSVTGSQCTPFDELAVGDLDGDGKVEIVCTGLYSVRKVSAYSNEGTLLWSSETLPMLASKYFLVSPSLCDLDDDGEAEILAGRYVLNNGGSVRMTLTEPAQISYNYFSSAFCADLDVDGTPEIVSGGSVYGNDGTLLFTHSTSESHQAVGQFDEDDEGEVLFTTGGSLTVYDHDGSVAWTTALGGGGGYDGTPPTLVDSDSDGKSEVFVPVGSQIKAYDDDGTELWAVGTNGTGLNALSAHDLNSDGIVDLVLQSGGKTSIYSSLDGAQEWTGTAGTEKAQAEYCVIADVDNDLSAEIVCPKSIQNADPGLVVLGSGLGNWQPTDGQWNQYGYRRGDLNGGVEIPGYEDPPWLDYGGWRQASPSGSGGVGDLTGTILEVCQTECEMGSLTVWFAVANLGGGELTGSVEVSFFANRDGALTLAGTYTVPDAPDGGFQTEGYAVELPASSFGDGANLVMIVDSSGGGAGDFIECDEENNLAYFAEDLCIDYQ